jgi:hypothetical protein
MVELTEDPEIRAMREVAGALGQLDSEAIRRVLRWAIERYQLRSISPPSEAAEAASASATPKTFLNIADLFDSANPQSGLDKVLVAAYWFQVVQQEEDLDAFLLNKELRHLGYPSTNITRDLDALGQRSPRFVIQVRKSGKTRQARKRYRLTREGIRAVEQMLQEAAAMKP